MYARARLNSFPFKRMPRCRQAEATNCRALKVETATKKRVSFEAWARERESARVRLVESPNHAIVSTAFVFPSFPYDFSIALALNESDPAAPEPFDDANHVKSRRSAPTHMNRVFFMGGDAVKHWHQFEYNNLIRSFCLQPHYDAPGADTFVLS